jgi:acetyl-CoA acetyltransferase
MAMTTSEALRGGSAIVGLGETEFVQFTDRPIRELVIDASLAAIADAGLQPTEIDGIITDDEMSQPTMTGSEIAGALGIDRTFMVQAPSGGAGYCYAPLLAAMAFAGKQASAILCVLGLDLGRQEAGLAGYSYVNEPPDRESFEYPFGFAGTPLYYAIAAQRYRALYGLEPEQLGALTIAIRNHGANHPGAQRPVAVTMADYLASPYIAEPFRLLDCCLRTTGAAAFVLTTVERARDLSRPAVVMLGAGYAASRVNRRHFWTQRPEFPSTRSSYAAKEAYRMSGCRPSDIDVAELQDPYSFAALSQIESCGFCGEGEAPAFVEDGRVSVGGELPVNTHGGQLSHGYLMSVTHIIEAVRQLRGEAPANQVVGAERALVSGIGPGDCAVVILGREA